MISMEITLENNYLAMKPIIPTGWNYIILKDWRMNFVIEFHWFDGLASSDWLFEWLGELIINELGSLSFIQMFQKFSLIDWLVD